MTQDFENETHTILLAVTGIGHGQKGTARAVLDEFHRQRDEQAVLLDLDGCLTGSELFEAARWEARVLESTVEKLRDSAIRRTGGGLQVMAALDPVAAYLLSNAFPDKRLALIQCGITSDPKWPVETADLALVPDQPAAEQFLARNMPPDRIVPLGIPLCPGFALGTATNRDDAAEQLGLDPNRPIILLAAESLAPFDLLHAAKSLAQPEGLLQVAVDLAGDWRADEAFEDDTTLPRSDVRPFGKTDLAHLWWASADLVVCHPTDHIVSRALALGKPLVTLPPDSPTAVRVARALRDRRVGLTMQRREEFAPTVTRALSLLPKWNRAIGPLRGGRAVRRITSALQAFANGR